MSTLNFGQNWQPFHRTMVALFNIAVIKIWQISVENLQTTNLKRCSFFQNFVEICYLADYIASLSMVQQFHGRKQHNICWLKLF